MGVTQYLCLPFSDSWAGMMKRENSKTRSYLGHGLANLRVQAARKDGRRNHNPQQAGWSNRGENHLRNTRNPVVQMLTIMIGFAAGTAMGAATGWLLGYQRLPSFIGTLGG